MASKLDILKIKPIAKTKKEFDVVIREPIPSQTDKPRRLEPSIREASLSDEPATLVEEVAPRPRPVDTTITDKRTEGIITRDEFLNRL